MGRPAKYSFDVILDVARGVLLAHGPRAVTVQAVADGLGAPSGSIYHRFPSRDALAIEVWLRAVERFQAGLVTAAGQADPAQAVLSSAEHVLAWCEANRDDARVLVAHSPSGLTAAPWPESLEARNRAQAARVRGLVAGLASRFDSAAQARDVVRFAVVELPLAVVRMSVHDNRSPVADLRNLLRTTVLAALSTLSSERMVPS